MNMQVPWFAQLQNKYNYILKNRRYNVPLQMVVLNAFTCCLRVEPTQNLSQEHRFVIDRCHAYGQLGTIDFWILIRDLINISIWAYTSMFYLQFFMMILEFELEYTYTKFILLSLSISNSMAHDQVQKGLPQLVSAAICHPSCLRLLLERGTETSYKNRVRAHMNIIQLILIL